MEMRKNALDKKKKYILKGIAFVLGIVFVGICIYLTKSNYCVDIEKMLAAGTVVEENGLYVETLTTEGTISNISYYIRKHRKIHKQTGWYVTYKIKEIEDTQEVRISDKEIEKYEIGEEILIIRKVYYTKFGLRTHYNDTIQKIEGKKTQNEKIE